MKKFLIKFAVLAIAAMMSVGILASCGTDADKPTEETQTEQKAEEKEAETTDSDSEDATAEGDAETEKNGEE